MFQSLLKARLRFAPHRETKAQNGHALETGKSGLKIQEAKPGSEPPPASILQVFGGFQSQPGRLDPADVGERDAQLAEALQDPADRARAR